MDLLLHSPASLCDMWEMPQAGQGGGIQHPALRTPSAPSCEMPIADEEFQQSHSS